MKKQKILSSAILMSAFGVTTTAFAVPAITDYEQATTSYEDAFITGNLNARDGNQGQASYDLDLGLDLEKVFSSPRRETSIDFSGSGSVSKGPTRGENSTNTYQALGSVTVDNYFQPNSKGAFWFGKGVVGLTKGQESPFTSATLGLGYGRVVNVTPMARSIRVIEALLEDGFLKSDPSDDVYRNVANIIDREQEYRSKHGATDYEQYWVQDIQKAIEASGAVNGKLNARAILKSYDVITNERISTRKHGWLVRAGVGAVITDFDGEDGKPALELGAEYHKPFSNQTQFSNEAILAATLKDGDSGFNFNNSMSLTHEISDTIDWENSWTLAHSESDTANDITTNTISTAFFYSLTNELDLGVEARLTDLEDRIDNNGNDEIDQSLNIGVRYRLK